MTKSKPDTPAVERTLRETKPELDDDWFAEADAFVGQTLVQRGRPRSAKTKHPVSLRLDPDVIAWFRNTGAGWQTRINDELRKVAGI